MPYNKASWVKRGLFSLILAGTLAVSFQLNSFASDDTSSMLLRTVPLDVSSYSQAATLDQSVQTADSTLKLIDSTKPLLLHMEALRRAYAAFGQNQAENDKLMAALKTRYLSDPNDANKFFDYGYAQLVMQADKNGLFFLRKANDKLESPYTSLAYGLAQIDADKVFEHASPDMMTDRKLDVTYKFQDALNYNKQDLLPGVWPSYINIMKALTSYPAFNSLRQEDVSTLYVPYGSTSMNTQAKGDQLLSLEVADNNSDSPAMNDSHPPEVSSTCNFSATPPDWKALAQSISWDLNNNGQSESIDFFKTEPGKPYQVEVMAGKNNVVGEFTSYKAPYIAEDLDNDGKFELVVREFKEDPYHPVYVYRWNGKCFAEDQSVAAYFK